MGKLKKCSEANLFLVPFDHYNLSDTMQLSMLKKLDEDIPPVFMILDTFEKEVRSILPGQHLFCVYGDNWVQSVKYNLQVLVAEPRDEMNALKIMETEIRLADKKDHLEKFQPEFYELIKSRESAYTDYIQTSSDKYRSYDSQVENTASAQSGGLLGSLGKMFSSGKNETIIFIVVDTIIM